MRHFYRKAKIEESLGRFCDFRIVDKAIETAARIAREIVSFRHPLSESGGRNCWTICRECLSTGHHGTMVVPRKLSRSPRGTHHGIIVEKPQPWEWPGRTRGPNLQAPAPGVAKRSRPW
jgi:hypothetical protein